MSEGIAYKRRADPRIKGLLLETVGALELEYIIVIPVLVLTKLLHIGKAPKTKYSQRSSPRSARVREAARAPRRARQAARRERVWRRWRRRRWRGRGAAARRWRTSGRRASPATSSSARPRRRTARDGAAARNSAGGSRRAKSRVLPRLRAWPARCREPRTMRCSKPDSQPGDPPSSSETRTQMQNQPIQLDLHEMHTFEY